MIYTDSQQWGLRLQLPLWLATATISGFLPSPGQLKLFKFVPDEFVTRAGALTQTLCGAQIGIPTSLYQFRDCLFLYPLGLIPHLTFFATVQPDNILAVAHNNQNTQH